MPVYEYEHLDNENCRRGIVFEIRQSVKQDKLTCCPDCGGQVKRLISLFAVNRPKTDSDLKNAGFTKLVRKDKGVYENVTATGKESRVWDVRNPATMPDLPSKIGD